MYAHIHAHKHKRQVERINEKPKMKIPSKKKCRKERQTRRSCKTERESIAFNTGCNYQNNNSINEMITAKRTKTQLFFLFLSYFNCQSIQCLFFHCILLYLIWFSFQFDFICLLFYRAILKQYVTQTARNAHRYAKNTQHCIQKSCNCCSAT